MSIRTIILLVVVGLAVSIPIISKSGDQQPGNGLWSLWNSADNSGQAFGGSDGSPYMLSSADRKQVESAALQSANSNTTVVPAITRHQPVFTPVSDLREVIRFDIDPEWVSGRWPRVSSCPGENNLIGLRVPLVTGSQPQDIHGSMTYYFDDKRTVQRITFKGWTGDASRLIELVTKGYDLIPQKSNAASMYLKKDWGRRNSVLRLDRPPVIQKDLPNQQYVVLLEINHPSGGYVLSQQTERILKVMP